MSKKTDSAEEPKRPGWLRDLAMRFAFFAFHSVWLLVFCAVVFALAGGASYWMVKREIGGGELAAPSVVGLRPGQALESIERQGLDLALKIEAAEPAPGHPPGLIFAQIPQSGRMVKAGSVLRVRVSLGSKQIAAPHIVGRNYRDAEIALRDAHLGVGNRAWAPSAKVLRERVISQDPPPGSPMNRGDPVNLLISAGAEERGDGE